MLGPVALGGGVAVFVALHVRPLDAGRLLGVFTLALVALAFALPLLHLAVKTTLRLRPPALLHAHDAHALTLAGICGWIRRTPYLVTRRVTFPLRNKFFWRRACRIICISRAVAEAVGDLVVAGVGDLDVAAQAVEAHGLGLAGLVLQQVERGERVGDVTGELELLGAGGQRPGFTLTPWTPQDLDRARHPYELPVPAHTYLFLDAAVHGVGSRACGMDVLPEHALWPGARELVVELARP